MVPYLNPISSHIDRVSPEYKIRHQYAALEFDEYLNRLVILEPLQNLEGILSPSLVAPLGNIIANWLHVVRSMLSLFNFVHIFLIFKLRDKLAHAWLQVGGPSILIGRSYYCWFFHGMSCCGYGKIMAHWTGGTPRVYSELF